MATKERWYTLAAIGRDGVETLLSSQDEDDVRSKILPMELRARMNSHRYLCLYAWEETFKVTMKQVEAAKYQANVIKNARCLYGNPWS